MDGQAEDEINGALTAQAFILQNIYALILAQDADPVAACRATASEMFRQFEDLAPTGRAGGDPKRKFRITQHGLHHLERFWANVEARLRSIR